MQLFLLHNHEVDVADVHSARLSRAFVCGGALESRLNATLPFSFADCGLSPVPLLGEVAATTIRRLTDVRRSLQKSLGDVLPAVSEAAVRQAHARQKKGASREGSKTVKSSIESLLELFHTHPVAVCAYMLAFKLTGDTYSRVVGGTPICLAKNDFFYICTSSAHMRSFLHCGIVGFDHCYKIVSTCPDGCILALTGVTASADISCVLAIAFVSSSRGEITAVVADIIREACAALATKEGIAWDGPFGGLHDIRASDFHAMALAFPSLTSNQYCAYHLVSPLGKGITACIVFVSSKRLLDRVALPLSSPHRLTATAALKLQRLDAMALFGGLFLTTSKDVFAAVLVTRVAEYITTYPKLQKWLSSGIYNDVTQFAYCFRVDKANRGCDAISEHVQREMRARGTMINHAGIVVSMMHVLNDAANRKQRSVLRQSSGNYQRLKGVCFSYLFFLHVSAITL